MLVKMDAIDMGLRNDERKKSYKEKTRQVGGVLVKALGNLSFYDRGCSEEQKLQVEAEIRAPPTDC